LLTGDQPAIKGYPTEPEAPESVAEKAVIYNDKEVAEIMDWLMENPQDRRAMMKFLQFLKSKKEIQEVVGAPEKDLLKEEG
jgi:hypothetical protein